MTRWRVFGFSLVPFLSLAMVACSSSSAPTSSVSPTPSHSSAASPVAFSPRPSPQPTTPAAAAAEIRATVSGAKPLLLPTSIPADWYATVNARTSGFDVAYVNPSGNGSVYFGILEPNPPPPGPNSTQANPNFHGDRLSLYQVDDATNPGSHRWLIWYEPGTRSVPGGRPGVPYFLSTVGLTDTEFWLIANSIQA